MLDNLCDNIKAIYPTQVTTLNRYTLFSILCQNSFPGTLCQNTILGTLLALVSKLGTFYFQKARL